MCDNKNISESDDEDAYLPCLPPHLSKGNSVSPKTSTCQVPEKLSTDSDEDDLYVPELPPHLKGRQQHEQAMEPPTQIQPRMLGPSLPPGYVPPSLEFAECSNPVENDDNVDSDSEDNIIGPLLPGANLDRGRQLLELRAQMLRQEATREKPLVREAWMTELPEDKRQIFGLGPRQFARKEPLKRGDQSVWTDTPHEREVKAKLGIEPKTEDEVNVTPEMVASQRRDQELLEVVDKYNKEKRSLSLMNMHKKCKTDEEDAKSEQEKREENQRRPFSREDDLHVNKFDEAQKKSIIKKSQDLNNRFNPGQRKFL